MKSELINYVKINTASLCH